MQGSESDSSTGSHAYPEMHRMLAVHEIVSNVLRNARSHDQAMAARASRLWCDIALDWLWRELDSVLPLLRLLAPLAETSSGLAFAERIDPHNWERFRHYARRVRFLRYDGSDPDPAAQLSSSGLASDVSVTLLTLKPSGFGPLLPHIQEINWFISHDIVNLQHALPFFSRSLKTLGITLGDVDAMEESDAVARFFNTASSIRGLALDIFDLEMTGMPVRIIQSIASFIRLQPTIRELRMPVIGFPPESDIAQDILHRAFSRNLEDLTTRIIFHGEEDYFARTQAIVRQVAQIRVLDLHLNGVSSWWPSSFSHITPFLTLSNLEQLYLITLHGFHLDPDDIAVLGKSFPKLAELELQPRPQLSLRFGIQATSLIDFAKAFPNLKALNIYIEPIYGPLQLPWRSTKEPSQAQDHALPSFNPSTFHLLDVGSSFLLEKDIPDMAELLSVLCRTPPFVIRCEGNAMDPEDSAYNWRKVEALVKLVHGAERDITKPYHEWCRALILDNVVIGAGQEGEPEDSER